MCEIAEVYYVDPRKSRKAHWCGECRGAIKIGEIYNYHHGVFDGSGFSDKVCSECEKLREELSGRLCPGDGIPVGRLVEFVFESDDFAIMTRFVENKSRRCDKVPSWMVERVSGVND